MKRWNPAALPHKPPLWLRSIYSWASLRDLRLEKTLKSPLDRKEIKPISPKENQPWLFVGRIDAEAEAPVCRSLWPPDVKSQLTGKNPEAGKDWGQEEKE